MTFGRPGRMPGPRDASRAVRVAELSLGSGVACVGEYLHTHDRAPAAVLLHDRGRDLDDLRPLAGSLHAAGFTVLSLDLPGHGLSSGDYDRHARDAVSAASLFVDPDLQLGVAFVAEGQTCAVLLATEPRQPVATVLLRPQAIPPDPSETSVWRKTPALLIVDSSDAASAGIADLVVKRARARTLRFFLHDADDGGPEDRAAGNLRSGIWTVQTTSVATRFLLEQRTYWKPESVQQRRGVTDWSGHRSAR